MDRLSHRTVDGISAIVLERDALREENARLRAILCPGCIRCGPPIVVVADDGCDGTRVRIQYVAAALHADDTPEEGGWDG